MKTAGRENPNRWATVPSTRVHGAEGQNRFCSIKWAAKQEKYRPWDGCFFLTSPFIELIRHWKLQVDRDRKLEGELLSQINFPFSISQRGAESH